MMAAVYPATWRAKLTMPIDVLVMVLGAAFVHAAWNALVKAEGDRLSLIKLMSGTQLVISFCVIPFVSTPSAGSWPFLLVSSALSTGYMLMLNRTPPTLQWASV